MRDGKNMTNIAKTHIIRIGNSKGVRIPKIWLEQLHLGEEVEMAVQADQLVIRSAHGPDKDGKKNSAPCTCWETTDLWMTFLRPNGIRPNGSGNEAV